MAPHSCEGPLGGLATLHVNSAMPNFVVQEVCGQIQPGPTDKVWEEWLGFPAMRMVDGRFPLAQKPGLGFELTEASLAKYPFGGTRPMATSSTRTVPSPSGRGVDECSRNSPGELCKLLHIPGGNSCSFAQAPPSRRLLFQSAA